MYCFSGSLSAASDCTTTRTPDIHTVVVILPCLGKTINRLSSVSISKEWNGIVWRHVCNASNEGQGCGRPVARGRCPCGSGAAPTAASRPRGRSAPCFQSSLMKGNSPAHTDTRTLYNIQRVHHTKQTQRVRVKKSSPAFLAFCRVANAA
jgi:hypothetical protein